MQSDCFQHNTAVFIFQIAVVVLMLMLAQYKFACHEIGDLLVVLAPLSCWKDTDSHVQT